VFRFLDSLILKKKLLPDYQGKGAVGTSWFALSGWGRVSELGLNFYTFLGREAGPLKGEEKGMV
jgi:hypothetical protein